MQNPIVLHTNRAMGRFGRLIRDWTLDPSTRPPHVMEGARICVIRATDFVQALESTGLDAKDFTLRPGVEHVELLLRTPDRLSVVLPEADLLESHLANDGPVVVHVARVYGDVDPDKPDFGMEDMTPAADDSGRATYEVTIQDDPFRRFIDPYMAAYVCTQCA